MFANPDGTWTLESYSGVVRSRGDDDEWVGIDPSLKDSENGVTPAAVPFNVEYGDGGSSDLATVVSPTGSTLSVDWPSKLPAGAVEGEKVIFEPSTISDASAGDGELVVSSFAEGFNFSVVLAKAPVADPPSDEGGGAPFGPEYRFPLTLSQGRFIERADGSIDIKSEGKLVGTLTPPVMWDSADEPRIVPVDATLEGTDASRELVLRPDPAYLSDPDRVYPVTVDPTVVLTATGDTWVQSFLPNTSQSTSAELRVGTNNLGLNQSRSYLNFDTSALGSPQADWIVDAKMSVSNFDAGSCSGSEIRLSQITSSWTVPGITWGNQPTVTAVGASTNGVARGFTGCTTEGVVEFDATEIVRAWAGGAPNYGVQLAAVTLNNASWRKYRSLENGDNAKSPKLTVTISKPPATPTSFTAAPGLYNNFITSKTPTLSAVVTDPDGGQVKGYFEIKQGSTVVWSDSSAAVPSGGTATIEVPPGKLNEATTYTLSAWGEDDVEVRSATPATKTVTVDTVAPSATITSAQFTNGTWTSTPPNSDTVTIDGSADTGGFYLNYDGVTSAVGANLSGDRVQTYVPTPGWHVFEVTPVDKAGNFGAPVTFTYGTGAGAFTTPTHWTPSTASFPVDFSGPPSATSATLQWRLAGETTWRTAAKVKKSDGTDWTGTVNGAGRSTTGALIWNATEEAYGTGTLTAPALIETRGCFQYSGSADSCTTALYLALHESAFGDGLPTAALGPATVSLLNGEAVLSDTDAADAASIGRTFSSLSDSTLTSGLFGPAWSDPVILSPVADSAAMIIDNRTVDGTLIVETSDRSTQVFAPAGSGVFRPVSPSGDESFLTLTPGTGGAPDLLELSRPIGTGHAVTQWEWKASDTGGVSEWVLRTTDAPGTGNDVAVTSAGQRPTFIRLSEPAAATSCTGTTQTEGCRGLRITYSGTGASSRVDKVERIIGAATQTAVTTTTLATYAYTSGKLEKACGPVPNPGGTALCTEYTYATVAGRTMVATVKPAGLEEWRLQYDSIGRLESVKRERPAGGDATWSIGYDLALSTAGLPEMTASKLAEWGQTLMPDKAYAVYSPASGTDISKAALTFSTNSGVVTNRAVPGPAGWLLDASWYDANGHTVRELDTTGWSRVQAAPAADRPRIAAEASSYNVFNSWGDADTVGTRLVDTYGPAHTATLENGTVGYYRAHTSYMFDDDPNVDAALIADRPGTTGIGLIVKVTTSAATADRTADHDAKVTKYGHAPIVTGDGSGWELGLASSTSVKIGGSNWSTTITRRNASGDLVETRRPGGSVDSSGAGVDARSTVTTYYTSGGTGDCGGRPEWAGRVCKVGPATQPAGTTMPTTYYAAYDDSLRPVEVRELSGGAVKRTTMTAYDLLGRVTGATTETSGAGVRADSLAPVYGYSTATGLPTTVTTDGQVVTTGYDSWGRASSYADATGNTAATTFDDAGRVATVNSGSLTTTYSYDARGYLSTAAIDGGVGTFSFAHHANGSVESIEYPNGVVARSVTDELGHVLATSYDDGAQSLLAFSSSRDVGGRVLRQASTASSQSFNYDGLGRLTATQDLRAGQCTTRSYTYNGSSERTGFSVFGAGSGGVCQSTTASFSRTSNYDEASRLTNTGYTYDVIGRTLTVPAADTSASGAGPLTATYRANDMVDSLTQDVTAAGSTETHRADYDLDPTGRIGLIEFGTNGSETKRLRYRYASSADSPSSVQVSADAGASWTTTKYVSLPTTGLVAEVTDGVVSYQVPNLHGDIVTSMDGDGTLAAYHEADEYGLADEGAPVRRYDWLGAHQRSSETVGGLRLMGVRLYNAATASFLSPDAIANANPTAYSYPQDPVNVVDLSGLGPSDSDENKTRMYRACLRYESPARCAYAGYMIKRLLDWSTEPWGGVDNNRANAGRHFAFIVGLAEYSGRAAAAAIADAHEYGATDIDHRRDVLNNGYALVWHRNHPAKADRLAGLDINFDGLKRLYWHGVDLYKWGYMYGVCRTSNRYYENGEYIKKGFC